MRPDLFAPLALAAAAAASAWWTARSERGGGRAVRLAASFVVAGAAFPAPALLLAGAAAVLAGRGAALAGRTASPGPRSALAEACGVAAAAMAGALLPGRPIAWVVLASFAALQLGVLATGAALRTVRLPAPDRRPWYEMVNVVIALLLAHEIARGTLVFAVATGCLVLLANHALVTLATAMSELRGSNDALGARVTELATLNAIGREILATLDPERVFAIVDRECRKIFDVDFFFIGVFDRETNQIRVSYRAGQQGHPRTTSSPVGDGLASWIIREKRAFRLDDARTAGESLPFRPHVVDPEIRSVLAVPLLVDDQVVGVLSVQSRKVRAYDDHQMSVLATIAQQAAVAVQNARHYAMATVDSLTGLYLRDYFFGRLEEEGARARRYDGAFALLMLDLDAFKVINDRQGHPAGDRYLHGVGETIRAGLRAADLACRYGGDEFCILLPETDLAGARPIAERLRLAIARLVVDVDGASVRTTVSIGIAAFPAHGVGDVKAILMRADQALYKAKRAGRDRVVPFAA
jgi:diguanylate cyclase (GGDEF)-like protein